MSTLNFQFYLAFHQQSGQLYDDDGEDKRFEQSRYAASQYFRISPACQLLNGVPYIGKNVASERCRSCGFDYIEPVCIALYVGQPIEEAE